MNKELPCYIVSDLLPLYQDDILSEETKQDIDKHISECVECKRVVDDMKMQINIRSVNSEIKNNPLKKIKLYQKTQTILGAIIAFFLGMCLPIVRIMIPIISYGEIPEYYLARLKIAWHIGLLKMGISGIIVCAVYIVIVLLLKKVVGTQRTCDRNNRL